MMIQIIAVRQRNLHNIPFLHHQVGIDGSFEGPFYAEKYPPLAAFVGGQRKRDILVFRLRRIRSDRSQKDNNSQQQLQDRPRSHCSTPPVVTAGPLRLWVVTIVPQPESRYARNGQNPRFEKCAGAGGLTTFKRGSS